MVYGVARQGDGVGLAVGLLLVAVVVNAAVSVGKGGQKEKQDEGLIIHGSNIVIVRMALKIVDKYEFQEEEGRTVDGVQIIPARHIILRQPFTLKKLSLKEDSNGKYENLVNELLVLKDVTGEWAIHCHKMLKTTNNLYLVYDQITENTLSNLLENAKRPLSAEMKETVACQLITILHELKQKGIVNLNITPHTVEILNPLLPSRASKPTVRLDSFEYAVVMRNLLDAKTFKNLPVSQFKPPEVDLFPPVVGFHCDVYSVGKVLQAIGFSKGEPGCSDERVQQIKEIIAKMTATDYRNRITVQQIKPFFEAKAVEAQAPIRQILRSKTLTTSWKPKELQQSESTSRLLSRKLTNTVTTQDSLARQEKQNTNFRTYCLQILKRRNLSIFLLKCCQSCSQSDLADIDSIVKASFLLLKKSTQVIVQLSKFLMTGHDPHIKIPEREVSAFFRTQDYFRLQSQVGREMSLSKKHLNIMVAKISASYKNLLEEEAFAHETTHQKSNEDYFKTTILAFLKESTRNHRIVREERRILNYFLLMSYLSDFHTYERMFDDLISEEVIELQGQTLLTKVAQLSLSEVVSKLRAACGEGE